MPDGTITTGVKDTMIKATPEDLGNVMTEEAKTPKRRYWINTAGKQRLCISLLTKEPSFFATNMYLLKECSKFTYYLYKWTGVNLKSPRKFGWQRN